MLRFAIHRALRQHGHSTRAATLVIASAVQSTSTAVASSAGQRAHKKARKPAGSTVHKMSENTSDASAYVSSSDEVLTYSVARHTGYLLLHGRRMWLPLLMGCGYYALSPVFAAAGAAATVQQCAYLSACVLAQRFSIHGRSNQLRKDLRGHTCVVTGGTSGIGLYTAMQLLDMGAHVVIASRPGKEESTLAFLVANCKTTSTGGDEASETRDEKKGDSPTDSCEPLEKRVTFISLNYNDQVDVMAAAARIKGLFSDRIDLLVNCAGMWAEEPGLTKQNFEEHIGVNFLGPFHFTEALLPSLRRSAKKCGRVVYVTCAAHNGVGTARVVEERMLLKPSPDAGQITARCYSASKLGNIYHAQSLAERRYEGIPLNRPSDLHPVDACCADPGFCMTSLHHSGPPLLGNSLLARVVRSLWGKDAYEGSQTVVNCCVRDVVEGGGYYAECTLMPSGLSKRAQDPKAREEVIRWAMAKTIAKYYKTE